MFELYDLIQTKEEQRCKDENDNLVIIPKGAKAQIIEKYDGWYMVEFIDHKAIVPLVYEFDENQIELVTKKE